MSTEWLTSLAAGVLDPSILGDVSWSRGDALEEMKRAQAGILKSGTCNLEGAVAGLPFVSVYSGSNVSKVITSLLVPLKEFSPVNIMRSGTVPEVFGVTIDEDSLEREVGALLDEGDARRSMVNALREVQESLVIPPSAAGSSVPERVAQLIVGVARGHAQSKGKEG